MNGDLPVFEVSWLVEWMQSTRPGKKYNYFLYPEKIFEADFGFLTGNPSYVLFLTINYFIL